MTQTLPHPADVPVSSERHPYRRDGLLCALLMVVCVLLAQPFVEMGLSDDWSYIKTAQVFADTGRFAYNGWAAMALGWQILWGALFAKLLGFSFVHVRLSTLPVSAASVYIFHRILRRFGFSRADAIFGTLALALSPVFLAMSASYMSDIYSLFSTLVCLYFCQRALSATTDRGALAWLCLAALTNIASGTVRQTAWLGVLVIVPSTAWLLRERRKVLWGSLALWLAGAACVAACMRLINHQPYFVPSSILPQGLTFAGLIGTAIRQIAIGSRTFLCLLLMVLPVLAAFLSLMRAVPRRALLSLSLIAAISMTGFLFYCAGQGSLYKWIAPWLTHVMSSMVVNGGEIPGPVLGSPRYWPRLIVTFLVVAALLVFVVHLVSRLRERAYANRTGTSNWSQIVWLLGPWMVVYIAALIDISLTGFPMYDRYLLTPQVAGIIFLLRYYRSFVAPEGSLPLTSKVALVALAAFAVAGTHDWFAISKARLAAAEEVQRSGVPRTAIQAGIEYDGWTQLEAGGYINNPGIRIPQGAFRPVPFSADFPPACAASWFSTLFTPVVRPQYFVVHGALPCVAPTSYAPISYRAWMPPFTRYVYVYQRKEGKIVLAQRWGHPGN